MTVPILITARMKSTRLPQKALLNFLGKPLVEFQIERLRSSGVQKIVICTSWKSQDDPLEVLAKKVGVECFRGDPDNVLSRYYNCAIELGLKGFLITYADEPFLDLQLIKDTSMIISKSVGPFWVDNSKSIDGTFCYGLTIEALKTMLNENENNDTEVWGPFAERLRIPKAFVPQRMNVKKEDIRLTIDYPEDFEVFKILAKEFFRYKFDTDLFKIVNFYLKTGLREINLFRSEEYKKRLLMQSNKPWITK